MSIVGFIIKKAVISSITSLVIGYSLTKIFAPDAPKTPSLKSPGSRQRQQPNTDNKLPVFYGINKNKGTVVTVALSSNRKQMAFIIAVGHGAINSVDKVYWGDNLLSFSGDYGDYKTRLVNVTNATDLQNVDDNFLNNGRMKFRMYQNGGTCEEMENFSPSDWSGTDRMTNTPFMYVEITYNSSEGVTRLGNLSIEFQGRQSQSIIQTPVNPTTHPSGFTYNISDNKTYSTNPARCFLDYSMDPIDGGNLPIQEIDLESLYELQEFCDRDLYVYVAYADGDTIPSALLSRDPPLPVTTFSRTPTLSGDTTTNQYIGTLIKQAEVTDVVILDNPGSYTWRPYSDTISIAPTRELFTCNGSVDTNTSVGVNMVDMLMCCQATPTFELGKLGVVVNKKKDVIHPRMGDDPEDNYQYTPENQIARFATIDHRFNENNIFGGVDISFSAAQATLNEITMNFNNIRSKFNSDQITIKVPESVKNTNEYISSETVTLRFTNNNVEARILGTAILNQSRQDISVKFSTDLRGLTLRSGDIFALTQESFGIDAKKFRVTRLDEIEISGAHGIEITGVEYADAIYDVADLNDSDVARNTTLLSPNTNARISTLVITEDTRKDIPNMDITFVIIDNQYTMYYEVRHKLTASPDSAYTTANVPNTPASTAEINRVTQDTIKYSITGLEADANYTIQVIPVSGIGDPIKGQPFERRFTTGIARVIGQLSRIVFAYFENADGIGGASYPTLTNGAYANGTPGPYEFRGQKTLYFPSAGQEIEPPTTPAAYTPISRFILQKITPIYAENNSGLNPALSSGATRPYLTIWTGEVYNRFNLGNPSHTALYDVTTINNPLGIRFDTNGNKMFVCYSNTIHSYNLSQQFNVSTAQFDVMFSPTVTGGIKAIDFNTDGTKLYVLGNDMIYTYTLSTGFDISVRTGARTSFDIGLTTAESFKVISNKIFIASVDTTNLFYTYDMANDFDIASATKQTGSIDMGGTSITFNQDGTKVFIAGAHQITPYTIVDFTLDATNPESTISTTNQENAITDITFSSSGEKMFVVGTSSDDINEYTLFINFTPGIWNLVRGADGEGGIRGPGRFSSIITQIGTPQSNSEVFRQDAIMAIVSVLGADATPVRGDIVTIGYSSTLTTIDTTINVSYRDITSTGSSGSVLRAAFETPSAFYILNTGSRTMEAYDIPTGTRNNSLDILYPTGNHNYKTATTRNNIIYRVNDSTNTAEGLNINTRARAVSEDIPLGNGIWSASTTTSNNVYFLDSISNTARAYNVSDGQRNAANDIVLGAGDWRGAIATPDIIYFVDVLRNNNIQTIAKAWNVYNRERNTARDILLGVGKFRDGFATEDTIYVTDSTIGKVKAFSLTQTTATNTITAINDGTGNDSQPITATHLSNWQSFALEIDGSLLVNGTVASDAITTGAINARHLSVNEHATGERMELNGNGVKVYDSSNVLRITLGDLS